MTPCVGCCKQLQRYSGKIFYLTATYRDPLGRTETTAHTFCNSSVFSGINLTLALKSWHEIACSQNNTSRLTSAIMSNVYLTSFSKNDFLSFCFYWGRLSLYKLNLQYLESSSLINQSLIKSCNIFFSTGRKFFLYSK